MELEAFQNILEADVEGFPQKFPNNERGPLKLWKIIK